MEALTTELKDLSGSFRLVPLEGVFKKMNRVVHEAASRTGKNVKLELEGGGVELDKSIVEGLPEPLMHLVRNSITHGIEAPETRERLGKPENGTLSIVSKREKEKIIIEISDDGAGIDPKKVLEKAVTAGIVSDGAGLSDKETQELIFHPGFSTAEQLSDLAGRGVGMDIVRAKLQEMRGRISFDSTVGSGTKFTIELPLHLAVVEGAILQVSGERFIVPLDNIEEMVDISGFSLEEGASSVQFRNSSVPLMWVEDCFQSKGENSAQTRRSHDPSMSRRGVVVFTGSGAESQGFVVNEVLGTCSTVVKSLETSVFTSPAVSGAAILADGSPCFILDLALLEKPGALKG